MIASDRELTKLSGQAGVDFLLLKEKYCSIISSQQDDSRTVSEENLEQKKKPNENLSQYKICPSCNGLGTKKIIYNHMTLERTCEDCDGDSIVLLDSVQRELERARQSAT
jgi:hypothetical protein